MKPSGSESFITYHHHGIREAFNGTIRVYNSIFRMNRQRIGYEIPINYSFGDCGITAPSHLDYRALSCINKNFFFPLRSMYLRYHFRKEVKLSIYLCALHLLWVLTRPWITLVRSLICSTPTVDYTPHRLGVYRIWH